MLCSLLGIHFMNWSVMSNDTIVCISQFRSSLGESLVAHIVSKQLISYKECCFLAASLSTSYNYVPFFPQDILFNFECLV